MFNLGQIFSHYKIESLLGEGSMGLIYRAFDLKLSRTVALKFLPLHLCDNTEEKNRFISEAKLASSFDHINICTIHDIDETADGQIFIVMPCYDGETLETVLNKGELEEDQIIELVLQITNGLIKVHTNGIIHRDIKPSNIIITEDETVKIVDFGIARFAASSFSDRNESISGSLNYMSPEQIMADEVNQTTDIWSLGVIFYQMLTGELPFKGEYHAAITYSILNDDPSFETKKGSLISKPLKNIVSEMLRKKSDSRYQSLEYFKKDLEEYIHSQKRAVIFKERFNKNQLKILLIILAAFLIAFWSILKFADLTSVISNSSHSIIVTDIESKTKEANLGIIISELLNESLSQNNKLNVMSGERLSRAKTSQSENFLTLESALYFAANTEVDFLVTSRIIEVGESFQLSLNIYNPDSRESIAGSISYFNSDNEIIKIIPELSQKISREITGTNNASESNIELGISTNSIDATKLYSLAQNLRYTNPQKSITLYEEAVRADTNFADALLELAIMYDFHMKNDSLALKYAVKAKNLMLNISTADYFRALTTESWVSKDWLKSIDYLKEYLKLRPNDLQMTNRLGYILSRYLKKFDEAKKYFLIVIDKDPKNLSSQLPSAYNYLGYASLYSGEYSNAMESFNNYYHYSDEKAGPTHSIGRALFFSGNYIDAAKKFHEALVIDPNYYISFFDLGLTYLKLGQWTKSKDFLTKYLVEAPENEACSTSSYISELYLLLKDIKIFRLELNNALSLDNNCVRALWLKGLVEIFFETDTTLVKETVTHLINLKENYITDEELSYIYNLEGWYSIFKKNRKKGIKNLKKSVRLSPRNFYFFTVELAKAYYSINEIDSAIFWGTSLLKFNSNDPQLNILLGDCFFAKNKFYEAKKHYSKVINLWSMADKDFKPFLDLKRKITQIK